MIFSDPLQSEIKFPNLDYFILIDCLFLVDDRRSSEGCYSLKFRGIEG